MAEYERAKILDRRRRGKRHAAKAGVVNVRCGAPYGYRYTGEFESGGQARYEVIEAQAEVVRQIFSWVALDRCSIGQVCRLTSHRTEDFRRGERLGKNDHIVKWLKPAKPRSIDRETDDTLPEFLMVRECRVQVAQPSIRVRTIIVTTTLLDSDEFTKNDLAQLYRARWNAERDLKSLKQTLQMDVLRCKTPELVRKEIWTHVLAYNLIRTVMAQAATKHGIEPRSISFKGTLQTLKAFQPVIAIQGEHDSTLRNALYHWLLDAISVHRVADRPDRYEPRLRKRRPKHYGYLRKPRRDTKRDMRNGVRVI